jgi:hypothetical protein
VSSLWPSHVGQGNPMTNDLTRDEDDDCEDHGMMATTVCQRFECIRWEDGRQIKPTLVNRGPHLAELRTKLNASATADRPPSAVTKESSDG